VIYSQNAVRIRVGFVIRTLFSSLNSWIVGDPELGRACGRLQLVVDRQCTQRTRNGPGVLARVLKIKISVFPNVFGCLRVLYLAISAHEIV
jgi:hypothetical protein